MLNFLDPDHFLTSWDSKDLVDLKEIGVFRRCTHKKYGEVSVRLFNPSSSEESEIVDKVKVAGLLLKEVNHQHIQHIHGLVQWPKGLGIVSDIVATTNLKWLLKKTVQQPIGWSLRLQILTDLSSALAYLHNFDSNGLVHGSLNTESILLTRDLRVQLLYYANQHEVESGVERICSKSKDVFNFGKIVFELTTYENYTSSSYVHETFIQLKNNLKVKGNARDNIHLVKLFEQIIGRCLTEEQMLQTNMSYISLILSTELLKRSKVHLAKEKCDIWQLLESQWEAANNSNLVSLNQFSFPFQQADVIPMVTLRPAKEVLIETVLIVGGLYTTTVVAEYNPQNNTLRFLPELKVGRWSCTAVLLRGHIYVIGGTVNGRPSTAVEKLAVRSSYGGKWSFGKPLLLPRSGSAAVVLQDKIYLPGGFTLNTDQPGEDDLTTTIDCYDPDTDKWSRVGEMLTPRGHHGTVGYNKRLYSMGGLSHDGVRLDTVEQFDVISGQSSFLNRMSEKRNMPGAVCVDGAIYVFGGQDSDGRTKISMEAYKITDDLWNMCEAKMNKPTKACGSCVAGGKIYAVGGVGQNDAGKTIEVYDPEVGSWKVAERKMKKDLIYPAVVTLVRRKKVSGTR